MKGVPARIAANLIWLVIFSAGIVVAAFLTFVTGVLFDDSYLVSVPMPAAGGVLPDQEVTVLGRAVGQVDEVELSRDGVMLTLRINGEDSVPSSARVQVLRRSPIGEQAVDFQPTEASWTAAEAGTTIEPTEAVVPAEVPFLLEKTVELFEAIEPEDLTTTIHELSIALDGRGPTLKQLGRDTLQLNRTLVEGIPEFDRLIDSSDTVLATLQEHREDLAAAFVNGADLVERLAEEQPTIDRLLTTSTTALGEADALIRAERANLTCLNRDLLSVNQMLLGPSTSDGAQAGLYSSKLDEAEKALEKAHFFFQDGNYIVTQPDPTTGFLWTRVLLTGPPEGGRAYPERRATPATTPGAACQSDVFGTGVNAVRQSNPQPPDDTSPGIDYAPLVESRGGSGQDPAPDPAPARGGIRNDNDLPATGGGLVFLAPTALGAAWFLRRRQ